MRNKQKNSKFVLVLFIFIILLVTTSLTAFAGEWDGSGSSAGGGATAVSGSYKIPHDDVNAVYGYRFSIYNGSGNKIGQSGDLYFKDGTGFKYTDCFRDTSSVKKSHIDFFNEYFYNGTTSLSSLNANTPSYETKLSGLPQNPTEMSSWLHDENASLIAEFCDADVYSSSSCYFIVEPIYVAILDGRRYALTLAEYAVYQSTQYGWTSYPTYADSTYGVIANYTGGVFLRHLYAINNYSVFPTSAISASMLKNNSGGTPSILMGTGLRYNTAADILKYQVGMGIYTSVLPDVYKIYYANTNPQDNSIITWSSATSVVQGQQVTIEDIGSWAKKGYNFKGWTTNSDGTDDQYGWTGWSGTWSYSNGQYGIGKNTNFPNELWLYPMWEPKTYTVYYANTNPQDNSLITWSSGTTVQSGQYYEIEDIGSWAKKGYTFKGWTTRSDAIDDGHEWTNWKGTWVWDDSDNSGVGDSKAGELWLYPMWEPETYSVWYADTNPETGDIIKWQDNTATYGENYTVDGIGSWAKKGYTFKGWTTNADGTDDGYNWSPGEWKWTYTNGDYGVGKEEPYEVWLYPMWEPISYEIWYIDTDPATGDAIKWSDSATTVKYNEIFTVDGIGSWAKKGYTFKGWTTNADGTDDGFNWSPGEWKWTYINGEYGVGKNTTNKVWLYPMWEAKTYTVYYANTNPEDNSIITWSAGTTVQFGQYYEVEGIGSWAKKGYTFKGWTTRSDAIDDGHEWTNWKGTWVWDDGDNSGVGDSKAGELWLYPMWAEKNVTGSGQIRFIKKNYLHTLLPNSKWKVEPLQSFLQNILSNDLKDDSGCAQVWHFSAEDIVGTKDNPGVRQWCLERQKGTETNKSFILEFAEKYRKTP